jgi:hypothetical protein
MGSLTNERDFESSRTVTGTSFNRLAGLATGDPERFQSPEFR